MTEPITTQNIPLNQIDVGERLRAVDEFAAQEYALSISESGLLQAIIVRPHGDGRYELVAGAHRLRAHELLERHEIRCDVRELTDDAAELVEIEENLFRSELTACERMLSLGVWDVSFREVNPEYKPGGDRGNQHTGGKVQGLHFARYDEVMAEKTGRSRRSNYDDLAVFKTLGQDVLKTLIGSPIADNAAQLKALAKLPPEDHMGCAQAIAEGKAENVKNWRMTKDRGPLPEKSPRNEWFVKTTKFWASGKKAWKKDFVHEFENEIRKLLDEL